MAGSPNALTALHLRYDPTYKTYLSVEQHLRRPARIRDLLGQPGDARRKMVEPGALRETREPLPDPKLHPILHAADVLKEPEAAQQTTFHQRDLRLSALLRSAALAADQLQRARSGIARASNAIAGNLSHPSQVQLTASSFQNRIADLPLYEQIYEGYGFNHDTVGALQYTQGSNGTAADSHARPPGVRGALRRPARRQSIRRSTSAPSTRRSGTRSSASISTRRRSSSTTRRTRTKPTISTRASTSSTSGTRCRTGSARRRRTSASAASSRGRSTPTSAIRFSTCRRPLHQRRLPAVRSRRTRSIAR